jgi:hypothetical protein
MHSAETRSGRTYHHNGDFSGEVWIAVAPSEVGGGVAKIPAGDLIDIVAEYIRDRHIVSIEAADTEELLGLQ